MPWTRLSASCSSSSSSVCSPTKLCSRRGNAFSIGDGARDEPELNDNSPELLSIATLNATGNGFGQIIICATESPTIFATGRKDSGNRLIGIPYRLAMIGQWARLFTQLTTFRTMTCFGESNGSAVLVTTRAFQAIP